MSPDLQRSLVVLGWPDILAQLAAGCRTLAGARAVEGITLYDDASEVRAAYQAVRELWELERGGLRCPVGGVHDIGNAVERAGRGLTLECDELRSIASGLEGLSVLRRWAESIAEEAPAVFLLAHPIEVNAELLALLGRSFDATGQLSGREYPALEELRRRKESLRARIQSTLDELLRDGPGEGWGDVLQDRYVTERNGRFVLPVKSSFRRGLGIVHGTSNSGETSYVEPAVVVELHNDLTEAEAALYREERRILGELSDKIGRGKAPILKSLAASVRIDLVCARVGFGTRIAGTLPQVQSEGVFVVHEARHPLLALAGGATVENPSPRVVIANDLALTPRVPGLVLTGPNAGGKTIALKTIGLFGLLVRAALPVPAAEGARVDLFDPIFADIGDQQSVAEGLSTFSAHIRSLTHAVAMSRPGALVLIDEITAGTDPTQGAALARAVVEALVDAGARVAVTTHFPEMKGLGHEDARFSIAAAQFVDGKPTFRLETGAPGASHAMAIARSMGMPEAVLERAEAVMDEAARALARQLEALDEERGKARREADRLRTERIAMAARVAELEAREAVLARRVEKAVAEEVTKARERLRAKEDEVRGLVAALQADPNLRSANEALRQVREATKEAEATAEGPATEGLPAAGAAEPAALLTGGDRGALLTGQRVRHGLLGVVDVVEVARDKVRVSSRGMTSWVMLADVTPLGGKENRKEARKTAAEPRQQMESAVHVAVGPNTLDLRGFRVDDAFPAIEQFFDSHRFGGSGLSVLFLLHGHGTGALKQAVRQWLPASRYVRDFRPANVEEGGDALTVVRLA